MTLEQVGNALGHKHSTIGRWEKGEIGIKAADIEALATLYGAKADELLAAPADRETVSRISRAHSIMSKMDPEDLDEWFRLGERLTRR